MRPGYMGTTVNLQIEDTCQNFPTPPKNPNIENFKPQKSFNHPCPLKFGVPRWEIKQGCDLHVPAIMAPHKICLVEPPCLAKEISFWAPFNFSWGTAFIEIRAIIIRK